LIAARESRLRLARGADVYAVVALTAVAAVVRFVALGHQSFWVDETVTAKLVAEPFTGLLRALPHSESTPPLYYVLTWCWSRIFGTGEAALRSLSALAGTLTIPVAFAAGRTLVSRRVGLLVAALAAVSPLLVWYSQEARAYALFVLLAALSLLFFARANDEASSGALTWWAASSALALLTHYFAVFLVACEAALLLRRHGRRVALPATAAIAIVGIALLPLAAYQAKHGSSSWIRSVDLRLRVEETLGQLLVPGRPSIWAGAGVPEGAGGWWPLGIGLLAVAAGGLLLTRGRQRRGALVSLGVGVAAVAAPIILSVASALLVSGRGDVFLFRNALCAWLPLQIAVAAALAAPRAQPYGAVAAAALGAASLAVLVVNATTPHLQRDDWRLLAQATQGTGHAIILSPSWEVNGLEYYAPELEPAATTAPIREIDVVVRRWAPSYSVPVRSFVPPPSFAEAGRRTLQNWVLTIFRAPTPVDVSAGQLRSVRPARASWVALERTP
jgi:mannosyltransferase